MLMGERYDARRGLRAVAPVAVRDRDEVRLVPERAQPIRVTEELRVGEGRPRRHVRVEVVLELSSEDVGVAAVDAQHRKKPLQPAHALLRVGAVSAQVAVVLFLLDPPPQRQENVEVGAAGRAPPPDRVPEGGRGGPAVVDERVVEVEEDVI